MRILALPVDDDIADSYNNAAPQEKKKINLVVNSLLTKVIREKQNAGVFNAVNELSKEAEMNGLTIEKLGELMDWDKKTMENLFGEANPDA